METFPIGFSVFLISSIVCLIVGGLLSILWFRARHAGIDADLRVGFESEKSKLQSDLANLQLALEGQTTLALRREDQLNDLNAKLFALNGEKIALEENLKNERENTAEKLSVLGEAQKSMTDAFSALSRKALDQNNESFVNQAAEVFKRFQNLATSDLQQRQDKISEIVVPVQKSLEKVDSHIAELEKERLSTYATIREQINQMTNSQQKLSETTSHLVSVLRNTKTRGRWGEIQLRKVVELAGMSQYCDFSEQSSVSNPDGRQQPDMIINLPAKRTIVIDAKAPMNAFLDAYDSTDEEIRRHHFLRHAKSLRNHVGQLSKKSYFENFNPSPEFVLLFLPSESVYSVALEYDPDLIEYGAINNVIIATPLTLIALLKAAAYGWRQEAVATEVKQIADLGRQLYDRLCKMTEHIVGVGDALDKSVKSYNSMIGSMESRVLTSARKFKDLQAIGASSLEIARLETIETVSRQIQSGELRPNTSSLADGQTDELIESEIVDNSPPQKLQEF